LIFIPIPIDFAKVAMENVRRIALSALVPAFLCLAATAWGQVTSPPSSVAAAPAQASVAHASAAVAAVKRVQVLGAKDAVEIEIESSNRLVPQTQVLSGPDRLVMDFPNAAPGAQLRNQTVNRGEVKDVRVGLFHTNPPVTRVVLDLKSAQPYQIFPNGKTLIIKFGGKPLSRDAAEGVDDFPPLPPTRPGLLTTNYTASAERVGIPAAPPPVLDVTFRNGLLTIKSTKASLSEILFAVHQRTGADVTLSAGAEQEKVAADIGPGPAPQVLTTLLNGSKFNYLILSSAKDPNSLDRVILSPKAEGAITPLPPMANDDQAEDTPPPAPPMPRRAEPVADVPQASPDAPPGSAPPTNLGPPHGVQPPPAAPPSTPPSDDSTPD
jgi:hypothetical protein